MRKEVLYLESLPDNYSVGEFKFLENGKVVRAIVEPYHFFPNPKNDEDRRILNPLFVIKNGYKVTIRRR